MLAGLLNRILSHEVCEYRNCADQQYNKGQDRAPGHITVVFVIAVTGFPLNFEKARIAGYSLFEVVAFACLDLCHWKTKTNHAKGNQSNTDSMEWVRCINHFFNTAAKYIFQEIDYYSKLLPNWIRPYRIPSKPKWQKHGPQKFA